MDEVTKVSVNGTSAETAKETGAAPATGTMVVAQPLEFKFNQMELQSLVKRTGPNMISVTTCSFAEKEGEAKKLYLCAIGHLAPTLGPTLPPVVTHPVNTNIRPIVGCPYPPAWKIEDGLAVISHSDIAAAPKFFILASDVLAVLPNNTHAPIDPADPTNSIKQVSVILEAETNAKGELETFVSFIMKDLNGTQVGDALRAKPL